MPCQQGPRGSREQQRLGSDRSLFERSVDAATIARRPELWCRLERGFAGNVVDPSCRDGLHPTGRGQRNRCYGSGRRRLSGGAGRGAGRLHFQKSNPICSSGGCEPFGREVGHGRPVACGRLAVIVIRRPLTPGERVGPRRAVVTLPLAVHHDPVLPPSIRAASCVTVAIAGPPWPWGHAEECREVGSKLG